MDRTTIYRRPTGLNLFEEELTVEALSEMGNPLERLSGRVDFEMFRPILEDALLSRDVKSAAGRKPIDVVLMFKVIFLQRYYGLGDHQIQYQIIDRTSFRQFLGIHTVDEVPDEKTVWACRNRLSGDGTFDRLFDTFRSYLDSLGLSFNEGKIIDATFVEAPRQRNTHEENKQIKDGNGSSLWQAEEGDSEKEKKRKSHKRSHKDIDARWTKKRGENHYGYKDHVKADKKTKLIEKYHTTDASVHDSNVIEPLIEDKDKGQNLWLDAGYAGKEDEVTKWGMNPSLTQLEIHVEVMITRLIAQLVRRGVEVRLIHAKEPGQNFRDDFDKFPVLFDRLERVLCPRVHFEILVFDCKEVYIGSANLTGAGLGMKATTTRNFEAGILTDDPQIVEQAMNQFDEVWMGKHCKSCRRKDVCLDPIA